MRQPLNFMVYEAQQQSTTSIGTTAPHGVVAHLVRDTFLVCL